MDILEIAGNIFSQKVGNEGNTGDIGSALSGLLAGSDGNLDIMGLVSKFQSGDVASLVSSWLGDGENSPISGDQVKEVFGEEKIAEFASNSGLDINTAVSGLSGMVPELIDKASSGGSLLDSVGGLGGLADMAKKLF